MRKSLKLLLGKKIKEADIVSIDIFDTLLLRDVPKPEDVFRLVEHATEKGPDAITDFSKVRILAQKRVKKCTLESIYDELQQSTGCSDWTREHYKKLEIEFELRLSKRNEEVYKLLRDSLSQGKRVILISDMYLNRDILEMLLEKNGIKRHQDYEHLFVSSEEGCTKKEGTLFSKVIEYMGVSAREIIHIGDAIRSDYLVPRRLGIKAVCYKKEIWNRKMKIIVKGQHITNRYLECFLQNHTQGMNYYEKLGFTCLGPLVFGFCLWINKWMDNHKTYNNLCFLSREGKIFMDVYHILSERMNASEIHTEYLEISRQCIIGSLLWTCDTVRDMITCLSIKRRVNLSSVIRLLGIGDAVEKDVQWKELKRKGFKNKTALLRDQDVMCFLERYEAQIRIASKRQYRYITKYFNMSGLNEKTEVVIVDIGWQGTIQNWLSRYWNTMGLKKDIVGLYMGVKRKWSSNEKRGFLFEEGRGVSEADIFSFGGLLESLLSETRGSVTGYDNQGNAVRGLYEYDKAGTLSIEAVQGAIKRFAEEFLESPVSKEVHLNRTIASKRIVAFGNKPSKIDIHEIFKLRYSDRIYHACMKSGQTWKNEGWIDELLVSGWKVGAIKDIFGHKAPASIVYKAFSILLK